MIQARQEKAEEDVARAARNGEVVRQSAARSAEKALAGEEEAKAGGEEQATEEEDEKNIRGVGRRSERR